MWASTPAAFLSRVALRPDVAICLTLEALSKTVSRVVPFHCKALCVPKETLSIAMLAIPGSRASTMTEASDFFGLAPFSHVSREFSRPWMFMFC